MRFEEALRTSQRGFDRWASQPHNRRWLRRIEGTPIPNDLVVRIAEEFAGIADRIPDALPEPALDPGASAEPDLGSARRVRYAVGGNPRWLTPLAIGASIAALVLLGLAALVGFGL